MRIASDAEHRQIALTMHRLTKFAHLKVVDIG